MTARSALTRRPRPPEPSQAEAVSSEWSREPDPSRSHDRWDSTSEIDRMCQRVNELNSVERTRVVRALSTAATDGPQCSVLTSRSRIVCFLSLCCLGLIPWTIGLALTLPRSYLVDNWPLAWIGFDTILLGCLGTTAWAFWKQRQVAVMASMITGVLLFCDAWFDVVTAHSGRCLALSISTAVFGEIPIATLLALVSVRLLHASQDVAQPSGSPPNSLWRAPLRWPAAARTMEADLSSVSADSGPRQQEQVGWSSQPKSGEIKRRRNSESLEAKEEGKVFR